MIPPPEELFVDINAKCPTCGHRNGKLTSVLRKDQRGNDVVEVQHHCNIDGANWYEKALVKDAEKFVYPEIVHGHEV